MLIDWNHFSPLLALMGGLLIGLAVAILLLLNGRIAGISGIFGGLLNFKTKDKAWRFSFILGLILSPVIWQAIIHLPSVSISASDTTIEIAGVLVGVGTRFASGCTSGHGICGLSAMSLRSIVATCTFMFFGMLTVFVVHHVI